jgi:prepilin-type N-terminal cleavage/methylation domain-containing protein
MRLADALLALEAEVGSSMSDTGGRMARSNDRRRRRAAERGFTLLELMTVVLLIAITAIVAVPTMSSAKMDRHAYDDAGYITQLFRTARTRAVGRGAAQLVHMTGDQTTDHGTFQLWEAVAPNPTGNGLGRVPVAGCKSPTQWSLLASSTSSAFIDGVNMNGTIEKMGKIFSTVLDPVTNLAVPDAYLCFTPVGRVYYAVGSPPNFDIATPFTGVLNIQVSQVDASQARNYRGTLRTVLVPGPGMARLVSQ